MSSEAFRLSDIADIQGGYAFKSSDFSESGMAVVKIANIQPPYVSLTNVDRIPEQKLKGLERFELLDGDVLMAMTGATVGKVGRFNRTEPAYLNQRVARISPKKGKQFNDFIYAVVSLPGFDKLIEGASAGSAQANISASGIGSVVIPDLSDDDQIQIGQIARCLDDRITLLRETNATLEAIAQALFKSWFVDFDPVRVKIEGLSPEGMDEATAALFPDSFEESELGLVPRGWSYASFIDTVDVIGGGTPKTSNPDYWSGNIPWYSVVDVPSGSDTFVVDTEKHITEAGLAGSSTKLLQKGTTIISARGTVGKLAVTGQPMAMNQSCYGLRGKAGDTYFTYFSTCRLVDSLKARSHGSVFDTITRDTLASVTSVYPADDRIIDEFERAVARIMERILLNLQSAKTLSNLRDTLLPRLISGQLRLPET